MLKINTYIFFLLALIIPCNNLSMQLTPCTYTLASTNPSEQFIIPQSLVLHSTTIDNQFKNNQFKKETCFTIQNTTPQDVLHFIACLKKVDLITRYQKDLPKNSQKQEIAKQTLVDYVGSLTIFELLTLINTTDYLLVMDTFFQDSLAQTCATKMIEASGNAHTIFKEIPIRLQSSILQSINKQASIDTKLMQAYSNLLEPITSPPRLHRDYWQRLLFEMYNNVLFFHTKYSPCYYNTQTETSIIQTQSKSSGKIRALQITKKNLSEPITIFLENLDIESINSIKANKDESSFICKSTPIAKSFVINLTDKNPSFITGYNHYLFNDKNPDYLYVSSDHQFGILDQKSNIFQTLLNSDSYIRNIHSNNDQSIIIHTAEIIYIGKQINGSLQFTEIDFSFFAKYHITCPKFSYLKAVCLHAEQDQLVVLVKRENDSGIFCIIDLTSYRLTILSLSEKIDYSYANPMIFLSNDILYISTFEQHEFINIKTGHVWHKKRYARPLFFTADSNHSIEIESTYSNGQTHNWLRMVPLFNKTISQAVTLLNKGEFPLLLLDIIQHTPQSILILNDKKYQKYLDLKDSPLRNILDTLYTISSEKPTSRFHSLLRYYCPTKKSIKGWSAGIGLAILGLGLYRIVNYFDSNQSLDSSEKRSLVQNIVKLIFFLIRT